MDMHGITIRVHFNVPDDLPTLIQCFGHAAHDLKLGAVCILLIKPGYSMQSVRHGKRMQRKHVKKVPQDCRASKCCSSRCTTPCAGYNIGSSTFWAVC